MAVDEGLRITARMGGVEIEIKRVGTDVFVTAPHYAKQSDVERVLDEMAALLGGGGSGRGGAAPSAKGKRMIRLEGEAKGEGE